MKFFMRFLRNFCIFAGYFIMVIVGSAIIMSTPIVIYHYFFTIDTANEFLIMILVSAIILATTVAAVFETSVHK